MRLRTEKSTAAMISVISNATLVGLKFFIGIIIGSISVISEALHSGIDLIAALIALFAVNASSKPPDRDHSYGHGKYENISGAIEAILIFIAAAWIIYEAAQKILGPTALEHVEWGIAVMIISSVLNFFVSRMLFKVGKRTESIALQADAWHLRTDVYTSVGVMFGLALLAIGERVLPHFNLSWIDPVVAIIVAIVIVRAAYDLTKQSVRDLLDARLPQEEEFSIREKIVQMFPMVTSFYSLRTRKSGFNRFVEFNLIVDPKMSVKDSHEITDLITRRIEEGFQDTLITIHVEPCDHRCKPECQTNCIEFVEKVNDSSAYCKSSNSELATRKRCC